MTDDEFAELTCDVQDSPFYALGRITAAARYAWLDNPDQLAEMSRLAEVIRKALDER